MIVGIAGGSGSGKTTVVKRIMEHFTEGQVAIMSQDSYYRDNSHLPMEERQKINFDHPDSIEFELLAQQLKQLKAGIAIEQPQYSYITCTRSIETIQVEPKKVIIVEGILVLTNAELRTMFDVKVFVQADADDRLARIIHRDALERGRDYRIVIERYEKTVKPMHQQFIEPSKQFADIILPEGGNNKVAVQLMVSMIEKRLRSSK